MDLERAAADVFRPYRWVAEGVVLLVCLLATCAGLAQHRAGVNARRVTQLRADCNSNRVHSLPRATPVAR